MSAPQMSAFTVTRSTQQAPDSGTGGHWQDRAECREWPSEIFEPDDRRTPPAEAWDLPRSICADCPVRDACLDDALTPGRRADFGMHGGLTPDERRQVIRRRNRWSRRGEQS